MRLPLEGTLLEKLRKIEALHAGTKVDGEREEARRAAERIRERRAELSSSAVQSNWRWSAMGSAFGLTLLVACGGVTHGRPEAAGGGVSGNSGSGGNSGNGSEVAGSSGNGGSGGDSAGTVGGGLDVGGTGGTSTACDVSSGEGCGYDSACLDDPNDRCEPLPKSRCPGACRPTKPALICAGLGMSGGCPAGLSCIAPLPQSPQEDVSGQCLGEEARGACLADPSACPEGFSCVNGGHCMPLGGANCWSRISCDASGHECPPEYALSRTHIPGNVSDCFGPCVPVQTCACTSDDQCPPPSFCNRPRQRCAVRAL
jgi:hypothetical protein